jgi:hypothetical protein
LLLPDFVAKHLGDVESAHAGYTDIENAVGPEPRRAI